MKKKIIKLSLNEAKKLYKEADSTFKQFLETNFDKKDLVDDICERIQLLDDICDILDITEDDLYIYPKNTKNKLERYINASNIIPLIVKCYNEDHVLDWSNSNECKYLPYFKKAGSGWVFGGYSSWVTHASGSVSHYYKNTKILLDSVEKFKSIYIDYISYQG